MGELSNLHMRLRVWTVAVEYVGDVIQGLYTSAVNFAIA
jgi:hypothetical protein